MFKRQIVKGGVEMKKIVMVGLLIAVVLLIAAFLTSTVMAAEKDVVKKGAAKTILIDKTSVSGGFSPASTYIMLAAAEPPRTVSGDDFDMDSSKWPPPGTR
jgi:flagellar basal body-associated protein FliL